MTRVILQDRKCLCTWSTSTWAQGWSMNCSPARNMQWGNLLITFLLVSVYVFTFCLGPQCVAVVAWKFIEHLFTFEWNNTIHFPPLGKLYLELGTFLEVCLKSHFNDWIFLFSSFLPFPLSSRYLPTSSPFLSFLLFFFSLFPLSFLLYFNIILQPASSGDDRAMCFTCSVCLVCWEPTDEPWWVLSFLGIIAKSLL